MKEKHNCHEYEHECGCGHEHHHEHDSHVCACGHEHTHGKQKNKKALILKYSLGAIPVILGFMGFIPFYIPLVCSIVGYLMFGIEAFVGMVKGFSRGKIFTEFTLMCVATVGAFAIGEYADAAALMYLYSLGEAISDGAYAKSKKSISSLMEISAEHATVLRNGEWISVAPDTVKIGEKILVRAGERVPLDAVVFEGGAEADTSSVTGESKPLSLFEGVECPSGALVSGGSVVLTVSREYENSVVARLKDAIKKAQSRKSAAEKKITRFASVFTPIAFAVAICVFAVGTLVTKNAVDWLRAAITVLVVACPCSLVLSVPLTYFAGLGNAAKNGIVFRGGEVMDRCQRLDTVVFDKTGTLTGAELAFDGFELYTQISEESFLTLARSVLVHSPHMAAVAFCKASDAKINTNIAEIQNIGGRGIVCLLDGKSVAFGNARLMNEQGIDAPECMNTCIYGAYDGELLGRLDFSSHIKDGANATVSRMREQGVRRIAVISGDTPYAVKQSCEQVGIDEYYSLASPEGKLEIFEKISADVAKGRYSAYCGDGLNDSAVIVGADVGIAMGSCGSALTVENADAVLMDDNIEKLVTAIKISKRTARIANSNIALSLGIKIAVVLIGASFAAIGVGMPIELAIVADVGAAVVTVLNSLRAAKGE